MNRKYYIFFSKYWVRYLLINFFFDLVQIYQCFFHNTELDHDNVNCDHKSVQQEVFYLYSKNYCFDFCAKPPVHYAAFCYCLVTVFYAPFRIFRISDLLKDRLQINTSYVKHHVYDYEQIVMHSIVFNAPFEWNNFCTNKQVDFDLISQSLVWNIITCQDFIGWD